jgi:hypothetical protein
MSHVAQIELEIRNLDALAAACQQLGLELVREQVSYRWYGRSYGDYPLPAGFTVEDLGNCEHAIRIPGEPRAYEIGVVRRRDGKPGYALLWDFYNGGYGLTEKVGQKAEKLKQAYAVQTTLLTAKRLGHTVLGQQQQADGSVVLRLGHGGIGGAFGWKR